MKTIIFFNLLVVVPFVVGWQRQSPAAVVEETEEVDASKSFKLNLANVNEKMMRFIDQTRTRTSPDQITMDSYIKAYRLTHEKYQDSEETINDEIAKKNQDVIRQRIKRAAIQELPPKNDVKIVKFELQDAKNPDSETVEHQKLHKDVRQLRSPYEVSELSSNIRFGKMYHEFPMQRNEQIIYLPRQNRKMHSAKEFPLAVQKAIDIVLNEQTKISNPIDFDKFRYNANSPKLYQGYENVRYGSISVPINEPNKLYFGDKLPKTPDYNKIDNSNIALTQKHQPQQQPEIQEKQSRKYWPDQESSRSKQLIQIRPDTIVPLMIKPQLIQAYVPTYNDFKSNSNQGVLHQNSIAQPNYVKIEPKYNYIFPHQQQQYNNIEKPQFYQPSNQQSIDKFRQMVHETYNSNPYGPVELHMLAQQQHKHQLTNNQNQQQQQQQPQQQQTHPSQPQQQPFFTLKNAHPMPQTIQQSQSQRFGHKLQDNTYNKDGTNIAALTALIGKIPSVQLQGLNALLKVEQTSKSPRPQDSTSPILFHPDNPQGNKVSTPRPIYAYSVAGSTKQIVPITENTNYQSSTFSYDNLNNFYAANTPTPYNSANDRSETITSIEKPLKLHLISERLPEPQPLIQQQSQILLNTEDTRLNYDDIHEKPIQRQYNTISTQSTTANEEHHENNQYEESQDLQYASGYRGYAFGYRIRDYNTGNDFGHTQNRAVDGVTRGEYHILLPDGRVQIVKYKADEQGYKADVTYENAKP